MLAQILGVGLDDWVRLLGGIATIVAVVYSRLAARNSRAAQQAIGASAKPVPWWRIRKRRRQVRLGQEPKDALASLTLEQKVDMLKDNLERQWIIDALKRQETEARLDRIDPPTRRH